MSLISCVVIGNESLVIQCGDIALARGHVLAAVVTRNTDVRNWATSRNLLVFAPGPDLADHLRPLTFDWLFSIANLSVLPEAITSLARKGAVNFHDGPLPAYAGLNAPVWALLNREPTHGVTWHLIGGAIDDGDILEQRHFEIAPQETALTLNMKCYGAAIESFGALLHQLEAGEPKRQPQDLSRRSYFARADRPRAAGRLDFRRDAEDLIAQVHALDHGTYWNPLTTAKIEGAGRIITVGLAEASGRDPGPAPGTVLDVTPERMTVATGTLPITLGQFRDQDGQIVPCSAIASIGDMLPGLSAGGGPDPDAGARDDGAR